MDHGSHPLFNDFYEPCKYFGSTGPQAFQTFNQSQLNVACLAAYFDWMNVRKAGALVVPKNIHGLGLRNNRQNFCSQSRFYVLLALWYGLWVYRELNFLFRLCSI